MTPKRYICGKKKGMKLTRILLTVLHLSPEQVLFQGIRKLHTPKFKAVRYSGSVCFGHLTSPIPKPISLDGGQFTFLNRNSSFQGWENSLYDPLWAYNLNYMDWLQQPAITPAECASWIDRFIQDCPGYNTGTAPYPTALRCINWIKFFCDNNDYVTPERLDSLYSQLSLLSRRIERNVGGNHLLEDAFALAIGASFLNDRRMARKGSRLLLRELKREILPDGAHNEQSPMYHCVLLDRLLDCINYTSANMDNGLFPADMNDFMIDCARVMVGHLRSIVWPDGTIPLLNDSAYGIAPQPSELLDYAARLGADSAPIPMRECGYRRLTDGRINLIADAGGITAVNQPGHTHADALSYELRIDDKPFIVDTGISTYNKNDRRQYERSTCAHNTVTYDAMDSSQVWGGFRVGSRAAVRIIQDNEHELTACHNGFGRKHIHRRSFKIADNALEINDICYGSKEPVSRIHFAPGTEILKTDLTQIVTDRASIKLDGATKVEIKEVTTSVRYNCPEKSMVAEISFKENLTQTISLLYYRISP